MTGGRRGVEEVRNEGGKHWDGGKQVGQVKGRGQCLSKRLLAGWRSAASKRRQATATWSGGRFLRSSQHGEGGS